MCSFRTERNGTSFSLINHATQSSCKVVGMFPFAILFVTFHVFAAIFRLVFRYGFIFSFSCAVAAFPVFGKPINIEVLSIVEVTFIFKTFTRLKS